MLLALSLVCAFAACSKTNSDDASDDTKKELKDVTKEYKILEKKSVTDIFIEDITQFI